ncbi:NAD(P)-binding protein [Zopfia rhizophila CBS 207.26]|uniref:NAD(P)-binding protein n=1 Tax=Zopfia rhizophila CBS 207.26 TaxID=1314779 RepID=A0A6A6DAQ6_9PEZI|nr:NAD(P)-binding protein [Zopfia rhizophila CBS 207.26]
MRALIRTGPSKSLTLTSDLPEPSSSDSSQSYIIRTHATALTRDELTWPEPLSIDVPIPGFDLAGTIISAPTTASAKFKPGDEVYALTTSTWQGNAKEVSIAVENELSLKPKNMNWEEAASVPLSALSAWQALFVHGRLTPPSSEQNMKSQNSGKRVLVTAASGGVGIWGVQLAHLAGAEVVGTCGSSNVEFVKGLGADVALDYTETNLKEWVDENKDARGFDVVLDCIGGQTLEDAWKSVRKGGRVVSVAEPPDGKNPKEGLAEGVEGVWFIVEPNGGQLGEITRLIERGECKGMVDSVFSLEQWSEAFERLQGGHVKGKVVLRLDREIERH